jgi:Gpi18-like mannosyltransferase
MGISRRLRPISRYIIAVVIALMFHSIFWSRKTMDWKMYFGAYVDRMQLAGSTAKALGQTYGNSTPAFSQILLISSRMPGETLHWFKFISFIFVVLLACGVSRFIFQRRTRFYCFSLILVWPSVVLNAAVWGQTDAYFTGFLIYTLLAMSRSAGRLHPLAVFGAFGLALSLKLQSCFLALSLYFYLIRRRGSWRWLWVIPVPYALFSIPLYLAGRSIESIALVYYNQSNKDQTLTMGAANLWAILPKLPYRPTKTYAILLTLALLVAFAAYLSCKQPRFSRANILRVGFLSTMLVPFFLPNMHERYFFAAEMIGIALAMKLPQYRFPILLLAASNVMACTHYLFRVLILPIRTVALLNACILIFTFFEILYAWRARKPPNSRGMSDHPTADQMSQTRRIPHIT